jgi:hypothetical protein
MTVAMNGTSARVAGKERSRFVGVSTKTGKTIKSVRLSGPANRGQVGLRIDLGARRSGRCTG